MKSVKSILVAAFASVALAVFALTGAASGGAGVAFGTPVKVTPDLGYGYEPAVVVDHFGNIFATAHKENWQLVLGPDPNSPTYTRSMSWDWVSVDGGLSFTDIPGLTPLSLEQHEFGDEGDMAFDDANHLYFVDTSAVDNSITRWTVTGRGLENISIDFTRPIIPTAEPVDDRPWITAHGNGSVFYFGNEGDKVTYPVGQGTGTGFGPGRYTVYSSRDGAQSFSPLGYTLKDSGWCRPAADHRPGSQYVYAVCTNDGGADDVTTNPGPVGTLWAYVSSDDGRDYNRFKVGDYSALDTTTSWPTLQVAPDGSIWALYVDAVTLDANDNPVSNKLVLFHSTNHGQTWSRQDITPEPGRYRYGWLSVSPDGKKLGLGIYHRPGANAPWQVYGAIWSPGGKPALVALDPLNPVASPTGEPSGDLMGSAFGPDGKLSVVWTRRTPPELGLVNISRDIFHARSL